ncbi:MAG: T9SS type A sorting domain-containing protein, partial [Bacteroidota bacterium]|nr:T9SS type A sorting domain-containing protein [Bacteroidota bacterium]
TNTLSLGAGSVAIDAGYTTGAPTVDQRNIARTGIPDVGAYELSPSVTSWTGGTSTDWNTASNWSPATVPLSTDDVVIPSTANKPVINQASATPAVCKTLTIASGAALTIAPGKALTVTGALTNNATAGLVFQSDANGTGSLIAGSVSGQATAQRWMTAGAWHMVSAPVTGQTVAAFLTANTNIPTLGSDRGMMDYDPSLNNWNAFFTDGLSNGSLTASKGFSMRVDASDAALAFTGSVQAGSALVTGLTADLWNCIGNPYTSAIGINSNSSSTAKFLQTNVTDAANIDPNYGAIYVWEKLDNDPSQTYTTYSNASPAFEVQQGQAFFVKMNTLATSVSYTPAMQIHNGALALKSAEIPWPTIKLATKVGSRSSETVIAFNSAMTKGLDPTYDAGLFKGVSDLIVYSRLVEDNGIPFAIQALPDSYSSMVIPVGVDFKTGGEVVFSAKLSDLPTECKVILEDKVSKTFTDLSKNTYTVTLQANSSVADRFQIHTSSLTTGINPDLSAGNLSAYAIRNTEIRVNGEVSKNAVATLYDIQGRVILVKTMEEGSSNVIRTPNLKTGIYLLSVKDNQKVQRFKLAVNE